MIFEESAHSIDAHLILALLLRESIINIKSVSMVLRIFALRYEGHRGHDVPMQASLVGSHHPHVLAASTPNSSSTLLR